MWDFPLFPDQASTIAPGVDAVFLVLTGLTVVFTVLVLFFIFFLAIRYRRGNDVDRSNAPFESKRLEFTWAFIPLILGLGVAIWEAYTYFQLYLPPANAMEVYVVGKQWMWKVQHPDGRREINQLHVPVGRPVRLIMTSEDVIHSFYIPAFRIKQDVLPGRYTSTWFQATQPGEYHLFCAEYCGTDHAEMGGTIFAMEEAQYQEWLAGNVPGQTMTSSGENLFQQLGCATCHQSDGQGRGPALVGLFGQDVRLESGQTVTADEEYIRESILNPRAKIVAGYPPIMPTFQGQVSDEQLQQLVAYIKSSATANNQQQEGK